MKRTVTAALSLMVGLMAVSAWFSQPGDLAAQSGTRGLPARQPFADRFWNYLQQVHYDQWAPAPGQAAGTYPGQSPHGAHLKMYLNRTAVANPKNPPVGSIIVKENYAADQKTLMAITVMYRVKNFDPQHGDWYWIKYLPDGRVDRTPPDKGSRPIQGAFKSCIDCHAGAAGNDFTFFND